MLAMPNEKESLRCLKEINICKKHLTVNGRQLRVANNLQNHCQYFLEYQNQLNSR